MAKFSTPNLRVRLYDGREFDVQTTHSDAIRFDITRQRMGWPTADQGAMLWAGFLAWAALRRLKLAELPEPPDGLDQIEMIAFLDDAGREVEPDDPAAAAVGPDPTQPTA